MRIIHRPRQGGKTTEILKAMAENPELVFLAPSERHAAFAYDLAQRMNLNLPRHRFLGPHTLRVAPDRDRDDRYAVDELPSVLESLLHRPVAIATFTGEVDSGLMPPEEIASAAFHWRAVADSAKQIFEGQDDAEYQRGLSEGYASALEMVLRGGGK